MNARGLKHKYRVLPRSKSWSSSGTWSEYKSKSGLRNWSKSWSSSGTSSEYQSRAEFRNWLKGWLEAWSVSGPKSVSRSK